MLVILFAGCSTSSRRATPDDTDDDSSVDPVEWDTDQGDFEVPPPFLLSEGVFRMVLAASDDHNIAVSMPIDDAPGEDGVRLIVFPKSSPQNLVHGFYPAVSPACSDHLGARFSQPYPHDGGYLTLATAAISPDGCNMTMTSWSDAAEVVDGPHSWAGIYHGSSNGGTPAFPSGPIDDQGAVTIASLFVDTGANRWPEGDEIIHFQIDRFEPGGVHETVLGPSSFLWTEEYPIVGGGSWGRDRTFQDEDRLSVFASFHCPLEDGDAPDQQTQYHGLVFAQGTTTGEVTIPPRVANVPIPHEGKTSGNAVYAFARNGDRIAVARTVLLFGGSSGSVTERQFLLFDLNGDLLHGPALISSDPFWSYLYVQETQHVSGLVWSGTHWGFCDLFQNETSKNYRFLLLDEQGEPVSESARLFWDIPAPIGFSYSCNVVPLGENDFAVVLYAPEVPSQTDFVPGVYVTYVTYQPVW
jgi:hypothetical protein